MNKHFLLGTIMLMASMSSYAKHSTTCGITQVSYGSAYFSVVMITHVPSNSLYRDLNGDVMIGPRNLPEVLSVFTTDNWKKNKKMAKESLREFKRSGICPM